MCSSFDRRFASVKQILLFCEPIGDKFYIAGKSKTISELGENIFSGSDRYRKADTPFISCLPSCLVSNLLEERTVIYTSPSAWGVTLTLCVGRLCMSLSPLVRMQNLILKGV
uniref:Uncharacterized protein n=1 Tax=Pyxicephalus adspersus TaxID=30357 RepID=A0AAV3B8G8_PYXAD|nr:TPA: hypothetical protein GDO54_000568 [Pyxicephalus adspersus]